MPNCLFSDNFNWLKIVRRGELVLESCIYAYSGNYGVDNVSYSYVLYFFCNVLCFKEERNMDRLKAQELCVDEMNYNIKTMKAFIENIMCDNKVKCNKCDLKKICRAVVALDDAVRAYAGKIKL